MTQRRQRGQIRLSDAGPGGQVFEIINSAWKTESDRVVAILGGAYVDESLSMFLKGMLKESPATESLLSERGPLSPFAYRIDLAYVLGSIDDEFHADMHRIREIRNAFAHWIGAHDQGHSEATLSFESPVIDGICRQFEHAQRIIGLTGPRDAFVAVTGALAATLHINAKRQPLLSKPRLSLNLSPETSRKPRKPLRWMR